MLDVAANPTPEVLRFEDVSFSYANAHPVIEKASLSLRQRDFACVIGPNGGGKTTLLKLALGLLEPDQGTVRVFGLPPGDARHRIGYLPQQAQLDRRFPISVLEVVLMGRIGHAAWIGPYFAPNKQRALAALAQVGLEDAKSRPFRELSGGQRQRILIARALACEPDVLLLDEPTANLDLKAQNDFYDLLHVLNQRLTIVLVSHDVAFVSKFVKTVVCVNRAVDVHDAGQIAGRFVDQMYGPSMRMVVHEHPK